MEKSMVIRTEKYFSANLVCIIAAGLAAMIFCVNIEALGAQEATTRAETLLNFKGLRPGLCVTIGDTDGDLLAEIAADGKYHVHALTPDQANVEILRESIASKGLYGQVTVDHSLFTSLPYTNNLINVLIVNDFVALKKKGLTVKELMRAVAPKNSMLIRNAPADLKQIITQAGYKDAVINRQGIWTQIIKPWPEAMDEWPQHAYDAGYSATSSDLLLQPPDSVQWIAGDAWRHESSPTSVISTNGRIFSSYSDLGIVARDAFNGTKLWQRKAEPALIATNDRLFARLEKLGPLVALDARTGKTVQTYAFGGSDKPWPPLSRVAYHDGVFLTGKRELIEAYDAESGEQLWRKNIPGDEGGGTKPFAQSVNQRRIIGEGKIFLTLAETEELLCLDLKTGEELWRVPSQGARLAFYRQGSLFAGGVKKGKDVFNAAYSPEDGKRLWQYDYRRVYHGGGPFKMFFVNGLAWVLVSQPEEGLNYSKEPQVWHGLNPKSGEVERRIEGAKTKLHCYGDVATERYIIAGGMDLLDVEDGEQSRFLGGRGSCTFGRMPANGLLYQTPNVCQCYSQIRGVVAFTSDNLTAEQRDEQQDIKSRHTGKGKTADEKPAPDDWPMLRHDPARSGNTSATLPADMKPVWEKAIGSRLSSPVVACGKVFVSAIDSHRVLALDMKTGKTVWSYRANGRVDSPPTIYNGMAIFGDRDGWVYSVSSATGELIWSLRAAPRQRLLMTRGQVESAWPVFGSILIDGDTAYFAAGRHSDVDGGIHLYAASPKTGDILWKKKIDTNSLAPGYKSPGNVSNDILVSNGKTFFMQTVGFDPATGAQKKGSAPFWSGTGGGFLTDIVKPIDGWHDLNFRQWRIISPLGTHASQTSGLTLTFGGPNIFGVRTVGDKRKPWIVSGYEIFSCNKKEGSKNGMRWQAAVPEKLLPKAILHNGDKLYVAVVNEEDGPDKGTILILDTSDGKSLDTIPLDIKPKFDGLAAVNGNLIIVGQDGKVVCLGKD
jgi:outer membrane protein assembly factor BamB